MLTWARKRLGLVALRGAGMVDVAFDITLGNQARSPRYAASAASAASAICNERDGSGSRPHIHFAR